MYSCVSVLLKYHSWRLLFWMAGDIKDLTTQAARRSVNFIGGLENTLVPGDTLRSSVDDPKHSLTVSRRIRECIDKSLQMTARCRPLLMYSHGCWFWFIFWVCPEYCNIFLNCRITLTRDMYMSLFVLAYYPQQNVSESWRESEVQDTNRYSYPQFESSTPT